ncbi:MAG: aminotransferase class V-fold PLP-dependent enzyme, partial [Candidatus Methanoplasma sp.]|nr:aminotransferase class V-fold PLP-dependent enzyme [Candidatus Methanoplasma sp.]
MRKGKGVYLDSACQSLRPDAVIKAIVEYYEEFPACGGRSVHGMSSKVSIVIDETRERLADFFGTHDPDSYVFTKNCTEGINTIAFGLGLRKGDAVVTSDTEHNSNHVPWMFLSENAGIKRRYSVSGRQGEFSIENFKKCLGKDVKLVSV